MVQGVVLLTNSNSHDYRMAAEWSALGYVISFNLNHPTNHVITSAIL